MANKALLMASTYVEGVDINVSDIALSTIYKEMVDASKQAYGSHIRIAAKFNNLMPFAWFEMSPTEKSEDAKILKAHKSELYAAFKEAGHSNPSVPFKRICDYGRNLANGLAPSGKTTIDGVPVEQADESDGAGPAPRSAMLRNVEERIALWKFNDKQGDALPAKIKAILDLDAQILALLGVDVATIAK
jgi:hypothetical protein